MINTTSLEHARLHAAAHDDEQLAPVAAEILLDRVKPPSSTMRYVIAADRVGVKWPRSLQQGWSNARCSGIRARRQRAKNWIIKAYHAGLNPQVFSQGYDYNRPLLVPISQEGGMYLGTLTDIKCRFMPSPPLSDAEFMGTSTVNNQSDRAPSKYDSGKYVAPEPPVWSGAGSIRRASTDGLSFDIARVKTFLDRVREKIYEVAVNENLGKQTAADILDRYGGGAKRVTDLTPKHYNSVYEACRNALRDELLCRGQQAAGAQQYVEPEPDELDPDEAIAPHDNPFEGVTDYRIETWEDLGDGLVGVNPASGEISIIGVFNDRRRAEFIRDLLLQAADERANPAQIQPKGYPHNE